MHVPFLRELLVSSEHPKPHYAEDLLWGAKLVGVLQPCLVEAVPQMAHTVPLSEQELASRKLASNEKILHSLKPAEFEDDLMDIYAKDRELGL